MTENSKEMPIRIQRKRSKGWKMPQGAVYVGRPTPWGNPYIVGKDGTAAECVKKYADELIPYRHQGPHSNLRDLFYSEAMREQLIHELKGKNLACWCALDQPCHADVLLEIANG